VLALSNLCVVVVGFLFKFCADLLKLGDIFIVLVGSFVGPVGRGVTIDEQLTSID
jgi:hypothetical protein